MHASVLLLSMSLGVAPSLWAQRLSGAGTCGKPEINQEVPIGDRPDHSYAVSKNTCTWTKPFVIAGEKGQGGSVAQVDERSGNRSRFRGHFLDRMEGGDTVHYSYEGITTFKDRTTPLGAAWNWTILGGSGKFTGVRGRGSCKGDWATGTYQWTCTGGYRMK